MSGYQQIQSLDESTINVSEKQERAQELSTDVSSHTQGEHAHSHGGHTHSHGGKPCNANHGNAGVVSQPPNKVEGDRCGHNHGPGQGCNSQRSKDSQNLFIRTFTMAMPCNCIILQYYWLNDTLIGNNFEYYASTVFMFAILFLCFVTYYQAVTVKNVPTKRVQFQLIICSNSNRHLKNILNYFFIQPPPCDPSIVDPQLRNNSVCKDCNVWKPMRTKHCKACGGCQLRMDHHCPWITNCVGFRNNRAFLLFTIYMALGATQYCYRTFVYFQYLSAIDSFWTNSFFFYIYWTFNTLVLIPITFMLIGLTFFHSILFLNNATTLDAMSGLSLKIPFSPQQKLPPNKRAINFFNRGLISNTRDFFSQDLFFFWLPFATITPNDGTLFETAPPCTFSDIAHLVQKQVGNEDGIDLNALEAEYNNRVSAEKERLKECNIQVDNKIFELWRDLETQKQEFQKEQQEQSKQENKQAEQTQQQQAKEINLI